MSNMITFPNPAGSTAPSQAELEPGKYRVRVKHVNQRDGGRVGVLLEVLDPGKFQGVTLWDNFNVLHEKGGASLLELLTAVGVATTQVSNGRECQFNPDLCKGLTLVLKVKHREDQGKVYVNVVEHLPA